MRLVSACNDGNSEQISVIVAGLRGGCFKVLLRSIVGGSWERGGHDWSLDISCSTQRYLRRDFSMLWNLYLIQSLQRNSVIAKEIEGSDKKKKKNQVCFYFMRELCLPELPEDYKINEEGFQKWSKHKIYSCIDQHHDREGDFWGHLQLKQLLDPNRRSQNKPCCKSSCSHRRE